MAEHRLLIELLREVVCENGEIHSNKCNELTNEQLQSLYRFAKFQDLAHIVGALLPNCQDENSSQIKKRFAQAQMQAVYRSVNLPYELQQIFEVFEKTTF